jgi:hypothetical protein
MMEQLNLPDFDFRVRLDEKGVREIFDQTRKKFVRLTPEEWVRQHFINYMTTILGFPATLIVVEAMLTYNKMKKRFDILGYNQTGAPVMIIECKAPSVKITQAVFDQVAMYNVALRVDYLVVTNGMSHFACKVNYQENSWAFLKEIPAYSNL